MTQFWKVGCQIVAWVLARMPKRLAAFPSIKEIGQVEPFAMIDVVIGEKSIAGCQEVPFRDGGDGTCVEDANGEGDQHREPDREPRDRRQPPGAHRNGARV